MHDTKSKITLVTGLWDLGRDNLSDKALKLLAEYRANNGPFIELMERVRSREATKTFPQVSLPMMLSAEHFLRLNKNRKGGILIGRTHLLKAADWLTELGYLKRQYRLRYGDEVFNLSEEEYKEARRTGILYYPDTDLRIHYWREKIEIVYEPTEKLKQAL